MIAAYKDRKLSIGQKVRVYRNLHNGLFSIKCNKSGLVVAHGEGFMIKNATPFVSMSGRQRVLDKKQRNVHAWITGEYVGLVEDWDYNLYGEAYYNPYRLACFVSKESMQPLSESDVDFVFENGSAWLVH